jgi:hypothetical protein
MVNLIAFIVSQIRWHGITLKVYNFPAEKARFHSRFLVFWPFFCYNKHNKK